MSQSDNVAPPRAGEARTRYLHSIVSPGDGGMNMPSAHWGLFLDSCPGQADLLHPTGRVVVDVKCCRIRSKIIRKVEHIDRTAFAGRQG